MAKQTRKSVNINTLTVDKKLNVRLHDNYDIPAMMQAILDSGRINDDIHARLCDSVVLRGNRRTLAGQELQADPNTPQDVAKNLEKVNVVFHDVTPGSSEELSIILDHGNQKGLNKTEVLLSVWRLDKQFMSEVQIMNQLYMALAMYTKNVKKANEAAAFTDVRSRNEFLRKWLHGTVGNYMLAAAKMGDYVRDQMVKTHLADDNLLKDGEKVECKMSRDRITTLSACKEKDKENGGWTVENGGETFNAKLAEFKEEDRTGTKGGGSKRPSVKELTDKVDVFKHKALKTALKLAAGEEGAGKDLVDMDDYLSRNEAVLDILRKAAPNVKDANVKQLLVAILTDVANDTSGAIVELAIKPFIS